MFRSEESRLKDSIFGSLELSISEIEMLSSITISLFELNYSMNSQVPEELKAVRDKLYILKTDLLNEYDRRVELIKQA